MTAASAAVFFAISIEKDEQISILGTFEMLKSGVSR